MIAKGKFSRTYLVLQVDIDRFAARFDSSGKVACIGECC